MADLDSQLAAWAASQFGADGAVIESTGLRDGGSPWRLLIRSAGATRAAILRVGDPDDVQATRLERAAMIWAGDHGIPVPAVLSAETSEPLLLIEPISGASAIPVERSTARLEQMGAVAARIHAAPPPELPRRLRSIIGVDFAALRRAAPDALWTRAEAALAGWAPDPAGDGFVHGDLWMGNTMWSADNRLVAVIDWDCAGRGPAGVDLGSTRLDAATAYGDGAEKDILRGWEREAGRAADDLARWDIVAALCTPPDMGWFATATQGQGRPDLTRELLVERRDAFLERALAELGE